MRKTSRLAIALLFASGLLVVSTACGQAGARSSQDDLTPSRAPTQDGSSLQDPATPALLPGDYEQELRATSISARGWATDFSKRTVSLSEFMSGGVAKDGIPAIDQPAFVSVEEADEWLAGVEPVHALEINGDARAYPLQVLIWHEIVNDVVGGASVAITFCPLCNSAIVFDATLGDGRSLNFGTTGNLRNSDLVMYDRQTETWWQQFTGEAIVGELAGTRLRFLPSSIVSWEAFKRAHPNGKVLSRETGHQRPYGENPYVRYDSGDPFLFRGPKDDRLRATERIAAVEIGETAMAFPFSVLEQEPVVHTSVGGQEVVVFFKKGTASALDRGLLASGRDVGATGVFLPVANGQRLTFRPDGENFTDEQTRSRWNLFGQAIEGPLAGVVLEPVVHANHFWFAWAAFKPHTMVYQGGA